MNCTKTKPTTADVMVKPPTVVGLQVLPGKRMKNSYEIKPTQFFLATAAASPTSKPIAVVAIPMPITPSAEMNVCQSIKEFLYEWQQFVVLCQAINNHINVSVQI